MALKSTVVCGLELAIETTPGVAVVTASPGDYVLLVEAAKGTVEHLDPGERGMDPRGPADQPMVGAEGRSIKFSAPIVMRGQASGTAYTASVMPFDRKVLPRINGCGMTFGATAGPGGVPAWTTAPTVTASATASSRIYEREEDRKAYGVLANKFSFSAKAGAVVKATYDLQGGCDLPIDGTVPNASAIDARSGVYKFHGKNPLSAFSGAVTWAAPTIRSIEFSHEQDLTPRPNALKDGVHAGFVGGRQKASMKITVEATQLSEFNPYALKESAAVLGLQLGFGVATQAGQRALWKSNSLQIVSVTDGVEGNIAVWDLELKVFSNGGALDWSWTDY